MPQLSGPAGAAPTVLANPNLALVFWGQFWVDHPDFVQAGTRFFAEFLRGHNVDGMAQYGISPGSICWVGTSTTAISVSDPDFIADVLAAAIKAGQLPQPDAFPDLVYVFIGDTTWPGILGTPPAAQHWVSTDTGHYSGGISFLFLYSLMSQAEITGMTAPGMTGQAWWATIATTFTGLLSHELYETFTDPSEETGYTDPNYPRPGSTSECCDICNDDLGKPWQQIGPWTIESYWSNQDNQCISGYANAWTSYGAPAVGMGDPPGAGKGENGLTLLFAVAQDGAFWSRPAASGAPWQKIGGSGLLGPPVVAYDSSVGLLEVFAIQAEQLCHAYQTAQNGAWSAVELLGGPPNTAIMGNVAVARNAPAADGYPALEAFVIGADGNLHHIWQLGAWKGWSGWGDLLGAPPLGIAPPVITGIGNYGGPSAQSNQDGRLEVFLLGKDGAIWHRWQVAPDSGWSDWASLGAPAVAIHQTSASWRCGKNGDGRLELFVVGTDGNIYHIFQTTPNGGWSAWGGLMPLNLPGALEFQGLPTILDAADGNLNIQLFTIATDGTLWTIAQLPPGGGGGHGASWPRRRTTRSALPSTLPPSCN